MSEFNQNQYANNEKKKHKHSCRDNGFVLNMEIRCHSFPDQLGTFTFSVSYETVGFLLRLAENKIVDLIETFKSF